MSVKVYVCHAAEDSQVSLPLLAAMDAWSIDYFFDANVPTGMLMQLPDGIQQELAARDVMLRVCTAVLQRSMAAGYEVNAFRSLQAEDKRRGRGDRRTLINVILDPNYVRDPIDRATLFIDATARPRPEWLADLGRAFGATTVPRRYSRRSLLALGGTAVLTVAALSTTGALLLDYHSRTTQPKYLPGQMVWHLNFGKKFYPLPTAVVGVVYVISDAGCAAYHATSGQNIWINAVQLPQKSESSALIVDGVAYFGLDSELLALRASDGSKRWAWAVDDGGSEFWPALQRLVWCTHSRLAARSMPSTWGTGSRIGKPPSAPMWILSTSSSPRRRSAPISSASGHPTTACARTARKTAP